MEAAVGHFSRSSRFSCGVALAALLLAACGTPREDEAGTAPVTDPLDLARASLSQVEGEIVLPGLHAEVEVLRDRWGVPHIYAEDTDDLFFAQGFVAAQDRLWQLDMWRRWLEGRSAEVSGEDRFEADRIMRLLAWRNGLTEAEAASYHPESERILTAFAAGINAYIDHRDDNLPVEFLLTGLRPGRWSAATPTLRTTLTGVGGSMSADLRLARRVAELGAEEANRRASPDPFYELVVPRGLDLAAIDDEVLQAFSVRAGRGFDVPLLPAYRDLAAASLGVLRSRARLAVGPSTLIDSLGLAADGTALSGQRGAGPVGRGGAHFEEIGSNNWVVSGRLTASGAPMLANDPHRQVDNPALRYLAHLEAPGWSVIGAGEPALPGIAIGHNERAAWGLTIVGTDQIDVFVEELDPADPSRVLYRGRSEPLRVEVETIAVLGASARQVTLEFSRHGPIVYKDIERGLAYSVRSFAQEPGTAPYLGSLRLAQVADCREFLEALEAWKSPSENMICGDVDGNIAWRASALTPNRTGPTPWYGRLPVPGTGEYEWDGFRDDLPQELNPERGWIATANHNIQPVGFDPPIMFKNGPPYARYERLVEMLSAGGSVDGRFTIDDFGRMQHDAFSAAGLASVAYFKGWSSDDEELEWGRSQVAAWDGVFDRESAAAALYMEWNRATDVDGLEGLDPAQRRAAVEEGLRTAMERLDETLGDDRAEWRWGRNNVQRFDHPLIDAFTLPEVEKTGGAGTVYANGATFREIFDLADWDTGLATTAPGQSGQPGSAHYGDLITLWGDGDYFPLVYSRAAVEEVTRHRLVLKPAR
jgi:penicillin amidase